MQAPVVFVGIPVRNCRTTVRSAVASVLSQTYPHLDIVVLDDGSTDGTLDEISDISDPRLRIVRKEISFGLPARLNELTEMATGTYIARMDGDDLMHPKRLERQVSFLTANSHVDVVGSTAYVMDRSDRIVAFDTGKTLGFDASSRSVLLNGLFIHVSVTGKRQWFAENPYSPRFTRGEDLELWVRTSAKSRFARMEEPLMVYRSAQNGAIVNEVFASATHLAILAEYGPAILGAEAARKAYLLRGLSAAAYVFALGTGLIALPRFMRRMMTHISSPGEPFRREGRRFLAEITEATSGVLNVANVPCSASEDASSCCGPREQ